jgi:hypothetical protein
MDERIPTSAPGRSIDYSLAGSLAGRGGQTGQDKPQPSQHTEHAFDFLMSEMKRQNEVISRLKARLEPVLLQEESALRPADNRVVAVDPRIPPRSSAPIPSRVHMLAVGLQENTDTLEAFMHALSI